MTATGPSSADIADAGSGQHRQRQPRVNLVLEYALWLVLIALCLAFAAMNDNFASSTNLLNIGRQVAITGIVAVGMTFVIITGGIDLSVGALLGLCSVTAADLIVSAGMNPWLAALLALVFGAASGLSVGVLVTRTRVPGLIVTLAYYTALRGFAFIVTGGQSISGFPEGFSAIGQGSTLGIPNPVWVMAAVFALGMFVLNRTVFGVQCYATGGNREAARLSGIRVGRIDIAVYTISGLLTGLASVIALSRLSSGNANLGTGLELDVITAVVLGGVSIVGGEGKLRNALAGVLILGVLSNGMVLLGVSAYWQSVIKGAVLLLAVLLDTLARRLR